jgi:pimeloyl-ACP methyl ester carboxylesterase
MREEVSAMNATHAKPTVVMVHGAWADGSSWMKVIRLLQARGVAAMAAPIPLTSLSDDVRALDRALERTDGPVVLAAHAYAGAVIGSPQNARVRALAFISALAPDEGETVADVFYRESPLPQAPQLAPDAHGFIWMPDQGFPSAFAQDASREELALLAVVQRPINVACVQEKAPKPLWKSVPSWYLLAKHDRMIHPKTQEFMASRMKAEIQRMEVDYTPIATAPDKVVGILLAALNAASA